MVRVFLKRESGATLVEYGVALILAISVGGTALVAIGNQTGTTMDTACSILQSGERVEDGCTSE